jgi:uncharacterized protein YukE
MGDTFFGSDAKQTGTANLLTPQQGNFLSSTLSQTQDPANNALLQLLQGFNPDQLMDFYQKGLVDPSLRTYSQEILPAIQERFIDANAGSSSALNQALAKSATDLSSNLSGQLSGLLFQGQQQGSQNQLGALNQILSLLGQKTFDPIVQGPQTGLLKDIIGSGGQLGAAYLRGGM